MIFIGRNSRGHWVVRHQDGLYGGLFVNRGEALRYALFENHHHLEAIVELSDEIELDVVTGLLRSAAIPAGPGEQDKSCDQCGGDEHPVLDFKAESQVTAARWL